MTRLLQTYHMELELSSLKQHTFDNVSEEYTKFLLFFNLAPSVMFTELNFIIQLLNNHFDFYLFIVLLYIFRNTYSRERNKILIEVGTTLIFHIQRGLSIFTYCRAESWREYD